MTVVYPTTSVLEHKLLVIYAKSFFKSFLEQSNLPVAVFSCNFLLKIFVSSVANMEQPSLL